MNCPNKNSQEWKDLVAMVHSETIAGMIWNHTQGSLDTLKVKAAIKAIQISPEKVSGPIATSIFKGVVNDSVELLIKKIKKSFPNIKIEMVNSFTSVNAYDSGYIYNGKVFINTDRVRPDTPLHEISHIFIDLLENIAPELYGQLSNQSINLINSNDKVVEFVKSKQPGIDHHDIVKEVMATVLGFNSTEKVMDFYMNTSLGNDESAQKYYTSTQDILKTIWNKIRSFIANIFGLDQKTIQNISLDLQNATLEDVSTLLANAINEGKTISQISSADYRVLSNNKIWRSANGYNGNIKNLDGLNILGGVDLSIKKGEEVSKLNKSFASFFEGGAVDVAKHFPGKMFDDIVLNNAYTVQDINRIKKAIDYDKQGTHFVTLEDFMNMQGFSELYDKKLFGSQNPMVVIEYNKEGKKVISLYNFTKDILNIPAIPTDRRNILGMLLSDFQASARGIKLKNTNGDISNLRLVLLANYFMAMDKNVTVNNIGTISVGNSINVQLADHIAANKTIEALARIPDFVNMLDKSSKNNLYKLFTDKTFLKESHVPYFELLKSYYQNRTVNGETDPEYSINDIPALRDGTLTNKQQMLEVMYHRLKMILGTDVNIGMRSTEDVKEIKLLINSIREIRNLGMRTANGQMNSFDDVSSIMSMISDGASIGNEAVQLIRGYVDAAHTKVVTQYQEAMNPFFKKGGVFEHFRKASNNIITDKDHMVFKQLFATVIDDKGKERYSGHIYWTNNENECTTPTEKFFARQALKKGISKEVLAQGKIIAEHITNQMIDNMVHDRNMWFNKTLDNGDLKGFHLKSNNPDVRTKVKEILYKRFNYSQGVMPTMSKTAGELFAQGKVGQSAMKNFNIATNIYTTFDEISDVNGNKEGDLKVKMKDRFMQQMISQTENSTFLGNNIRLIKELGIEVTTDAKGKPMFKTIDDGKKNDAASMDMVTLLSYFTMSSVRMRVYEDELLPVVNGVKVLLNDMKDNKNFDMTQTLKYIDTYTIQGIEGERKRMDNKKLGIDVDKAVASISTFANLSTMTFNVNVGVMSTLSNAVRAYIEGIAHNIADSFTPEEFHQYFRVEHLVKATGLFFSDFGKVTQMGQMYGVTNMNDYELISHRMHTGKKYAFSDYWTNWMNWGSDFMARSIVMTAQMLKDGSYDAHEYDKKTGKITIDASKYKKIYQSRTKYNPEGGKEYEKWLKDTLVLEGRQKESDPLKYLYTSKEMKVFKFLADKFIVGSYDNKVRPIMGAYLVGKMFLQFKTYMMSVITNAIQPLETLEDGGRILMVKDEEGNYIPEWQRLMVEGYTRTVLRRMKELAAVRSFKDMQKLQPHEVYNFSKIATSVVMYLGMMLLYGFTVDDDRKKKGIHASNKIDEFRLIRNWKYVYNSIFVMGNITEVIKSPFAAGNIISDMFYDVTGKFNPLHKYPLAGTIKTFDEVFTGKTQRQQAYEERNEDNNNN